MLLKPQSLAAAAAVLALVVFGFRPWSNHAENGAWWLAPSAAWAGQLHNAIEQAQQRGFSCREHFVHVLAAGSQATSSSTSTLFVAGNRYRRDSYELGDLRESQWYVHGPEGLTCTSVRYDDNTYTVTNDPNAKASDESPMARLEGLARRLEEAGRRVGTTRIAGRHAVEFEIAAKKLDAQDDEAMVHVWLDQTTKMPLKITYRFATPGGLAEIVAMTLVQDQFEWHTTLPANAFEPQIPAGFTKAQAN